MHVAARRTVDAFQRLPAQVVSERGACMSAKKAITILLGLTCALTVMAAGPQVSAQPAGIPRRIEVRPIALKIELFSSLVEVYQANVTHPEIWQDVYVGELSGDAEAVAHYKWLKDTYRTFSPRMREDLRYFFAQAHAWDFINLFIDLPDSASIDAVIAHVMQSSDARLTQALGAVAGDDGFRPRLVSFLSHYHRDHLQDYILRRKAGSIQRAKKLNAAPDFDILSFMEAETGVKFTPASRKTLFYLTTAYMGSMGFERTGTFVCLLQANVASLPEMMGTAFHEFGHSLFRSLVQSSDFGTMAGRLMQDPDLASAQLQFSETYDTIQFLEENLVDGCSLYLMYRHGDVSLAWMERVPVYTDFERRFALALVRDFDPVEETLFTFTRMFIEAYAREVGV